MLSFTGSMRNRIAPALALAALTTSAGAAPLVRDVDGDGTEDKVDLEPTGDLAIQTKAKTSKVAVGLKRGTVSAAIVRGTPTIVVRGDTEAVVLQLAGSQWKQLVRTKVGGVGLDADYGVDVAALPDGLFRYQVRPGFQRCDGQPALLFAERFDTGKFRRLARLPVGIPDSAPVIQAKQDSTGAPDPLTYKARFASHQVGAADAGSLGIPSELDDNKPATTWREELVASAGEGQFFTYVPRVPDAKAAQIRIVTATQKDANRPQRIGVVAASGSWHIELPATAAKDPPGTAYVADLPSPVAGCVTLVLESTFGPDKGTTQIAELSVYAEGDRNGGGEASLANAIADGKDGAVSAAKALATRGPAAAAAIDAELGRVKDAASRRRLVQAAVGVTDPSIAPILARIALQGDVEGADLVEVILALGRFGNTQELHDLAMRPALALEARVAAVRGLAPKSDKDRDLLVDLAGEGPREVRRAVIEALTVIPTAALVAAAGASTTEASAGDLWRAVTRRVRQHTDE